jgi:hypothetical protein
MTDTFRRYYATHRLPIFVGIIAIVYIYLTLHISVDKKILRHYHLSNNRLTFLLLTIIVPYLIIWAVAIFGYLRLKFYALMLSKSVDGDAFTHIARGVLLLAIWPPLSALLGSVVSHLAPSHLSLIPWAARIENYFILVLLLVASYQLKVGASKLRKLAKTTPAPQWERWLQIGYLVMAVLYVALSLHDPMRQHAAAAAPTNSSFLPDWLLLVTLILPRLITWYWGLQAIWNMLQYSRFVPGRIYRRPLRQAAAGLGVIIAMSIALRYLNTLTVLNHASLNWLLVVVYSLLFLMGVGYCLLARGAHLLTKIEQV